MITLATTPNLYRTSRASRLLAGLLNRAALLLCFAGLLALSVWQLEERRQSQATAAQQRAEDCEVLMRSLSDIDAITPYRYHKTLLRLYRLMERICPPL